MQNFPHTTCAHVKGPKKILGTLVPLPLG